MEFLKSIFGGTKAKLETITNTVWGYLTPPSYSTRYRTYIKTVYRNPSVAPALEILQANFINIEYKVIQKNKVIKNGKEIEVQEYVNNDWVTKTLKKPSVLTTKTEFKRYFLFYYLFGGRVLVEKVDHSFCSSLIMYAPDTYDFNYKMDKPAIDSIQFASTTVSGEDLNRYYLMKDIDPETMIAGFGNGASRLEALAGICDLINFIITHNNTLLSNSGHKGGLFRITKELKTKSQRDELEEKIRTALSGYNNAGKSGLIPSDVEYIPTEIAPKDLDWTEGWIVAHKMVANIMGVPLTMIWDTSSTYNNTREDKIKLYKQVLIPLAKSFADFLNEVFADNLLEGQEIVIDLSSIEDLKEDAFDTLKSLETVSYLTINEKRDIASKMTNIQIEPYKDENADKIFINTMLIKLDDVGITDEEIGGEDEEEDN